jgi:hypothetical protein
MRTELAALKSILDQALETLPDDLPENRTARCRELLASALSRRAITQTGEESLS